MVIPTANKIFGASGTPPKYSSRQTLRAQVGLSRTICLLPCPECDFKFVSDCYFHNCFQVGAISSMI